ncbi:C-GCAxxG-C-C family (seleno)protein [Clostridium sp. DL1XJH146]
MLKETMQKYRDKDLYDLSCSETMLYAANEEYNLNLSQDTLKSMAGFSGGMYANETCGCITGSIAVLSIMFVEESAHKSEHLKEIVQEFIDGFWVKHKFKHCENLKDIYRTEEFGCNDLMYSTAELLDNTICKELNK